MQADTSDVGFRLLLTLGNLWDGLLGAQIDPSVRGLHLTREYYGGYIRFAAGPSATPRLIVEWNESSRHLRVIRCQEWPGFEAIVASTIAYVRTAARERGIAEEVEGPFRSACEEPAPVRRTVVMSLTAQMEARRALD